MKFTQIRNATAHIEYAGKKFLIDPVFAPKDAYPGFEGSLNSHLNWPTVELPFDIEKILDVDAIIITHTHPDHLDEAALHAIPKNMKLLVQNDEDKEFITNAGFTNITILGKNSHFEGIDLSITGGQHGSDKAMQEWGALLGKVSGVVFSHPDEKTVYLAGDTIWNAEVEKAIQEYSPQMMILNMGDAQIPGFGSIIMGKEDALRAHQASPNAQIIATHMEAVNHAALTRNELRDFVNKNDLEKYVFAPENEESLTF